MHAIFADSTKLQELHKCYTHTLNIMDFNAVAEALCSWRYFHRTFKNLLEDKCTTYQLNILAINVMLHIEEGEVASICSSIQNDELTVSLKQLHQSRCTNL